MLFRLDQIFGLEILDEPGAPPPDFDLKAFAEQSFGVFQEPPEEIVLSFAPEAAPDARYRSKWNSRQSGSGGAPFTGTTGAVTYPADRARQLGSSSKAWRSLAARRFSETGFTPPVRAWGQGRVAPASSAGQTLD